MKKITALFVLALAVSGMAIAQTPKMPAAKAPTSIKCAVMPDDMVNIAQATKSKKYADYKGRRYFFCCAGCPEKFAANPAKYAKAASIPSPVAKKMKMGKKVA